MKMETPEGRGRRPGTMVNVGDVMMKVREDDERRVYVSDNIVINGMGKFAYEV